MKADRKHVELVYPIGAGRFLVASSPSSRALGLDDKVVCGFSVVLRNPALPALQLDLNSYGPGAIIKHEVEWLVADNWQWLPTGQSFGQDRRAECRLCQDAANAALRQVGRLVDRIEYRLCRCIPPFLERVDPQTVSISKERKDGATLIVSGRSKKTF